MVIFGQEENWKYLHGILMESLLHYMMTPL